MTLYVTRVYDGMKIIYMENVIIYNENKQPVQAIKANYINEQGDLTFRYINNGKAEVY